MADISIISMPYGGHVVFQVGQQANPGGKLANGFTWQAYRAIVTALWEDYSPHEILEIATKAAKGEKVPVSTMQAMVIAVMAKVIREGCGKTLEMILDRVLGRVPQVVQMPGNNSPAGLLGSVDALGDEDMDTFMELVDVIRAKKALPAIAAPPSDTSD